MKRSKFVGCVLCCCFLMSLSQMANAGQSVSIEYDANNAMHAFGVTELQEALDATGHKLLKEGADFHIVFAEYRKGMGPQSFRIQKEGARGIRIFSGDSIGAMYGAIEVAERSGCRSAAAWCSKLLHCGIAQT